MYYILGNDYRYYAGKCPYSKRVLVWEEFPSGALCFNSMEEAIDKAKNDNIFYLGIEYVRGVR